MLLGTLIEINEATKKGKIEQDLNHRIYDFDFSIWDDCNGSMELNAEVEFNVEMRVVIKAYIKPKPVNEDEIPMTKLPTACIEEFFARENEILSDYSDFIEGHSSLDFLRMRRFLLTAYNDLRDMDNGIENDVLKQLKSEINRLFSEFEEYIKKAKYTPSYAFEKIFLARQVEFIRVERDIEDIQSALANAKSQCQVLGSTLETEEKNLLKLAHSKGSQEYQAFEKEVKSMRKRYVDLIQFIATRQELLVKQKERIKNFREMHYNSFVNVYAPMLKDIKERFIGLLDSKAYDLDSMLWARAKQSHQVRRFFRDARIEGGFSSKTFLRYFLRGLDRNKLSSQSKELFNLLQYLEEVSHKNIMVLRTSNVDVQKTKDIIQKIDSTLTITTDTNPINALKTLAQKPQDIVVLSDKIGAMSAIDFIHNIKHLPNQKDNMTFCMIVSKMPELEDAQLARELGVKYFVPDQNMDALFDSVRMAL